MALLAQLFGEGREIGALQECARAVLIFGFGLGAVRLAGRRVFAKWAALDIVVAIIAGSNLSRALTGSAPLWGTLAATGLLLAVHALLARAAAVWPPASRLLEGAPIPLARDGALDRAALRRHGVSGTDLAEALHAAGVDQVEDTGLVLQEPSGKINVLHLK